MSVVVGILVYQKSDDIIIPSDAIRVRIIANSNNIGDLYAKKQIKNEIKDDLYNLVKDAKDSSEARVIISSNLEKITKMISARTDDFKISYGKNYFPKKTYKGVIYEEGHYDSLVITLGEGMGDNWWCVLYPPLCLIEDNDNTTNVEYRSYVMDVLNK